MTKISSASVLEINKVKTRRSQAGKEKNLPNLDDKNLSKNLFSIFSLQSDGNPSYI